MVISFGTAGGVPGKSKVGDVVMADACLFLDRLRTHNQNVFDWGLWGGGCIPTAQMRLDLGLTAGVCASQIGWAPSAVCCALHCVLHVHSLALFLLPCQSSPATCLQVRNLVAADGNHPQARNSLPRYGVCTVWPGAEPMWCQPHRAQGVIPPPLRVPPPSPHHVITVSSPIHACALFTTQCSCRC